jgi:hypothetical protein
MTLADRHSALLSAGLAVLVSLSGCHSTRYRTAGYSSPETGLEATHAALQSIHVREPPYVRGPSDPAAMPETIGDELDDSEPIFPRSERRISRTANSSEPVETSARSATATRLEPLPIRLPLPITQRNSTGSERSRGDAGWTSSPLSEPVRLFDPPALLTPPGEAR